MNKRARALFTLNPPPFRRSIDLIENRSCDRVVVVVVVVVVSRATKPPRAGCVSSSLVDETRARRVNLKKKRQSNQSNRGEEKRARSLDPFSRVRVSVRVSVVGFALARARALPRVLLLDLLNLVVVARTSQRWRVSRNPRRGVPP